MQRENEKKAELDDDILQCRLDVQRALQAAKRVPPRAIRGPEQPDTEAVQPIQSLQSLNVEYKNPESTPSKYTIQEQPGPPVGIHILPFETLQKNRSASPNSAPSPSSAPSEQANDATDIKPSQASIEHLHTKLHLLEQDIESGKTIQKTLEGQLEGKTAAFDEMTEQNRKLQESLDASAQSADTQRTKIEELERELAEKIGQIATLKQQIDEHAAALAEQTDRLRQAGEEKEASEKCHEAQTAEWAKILESLKAAQESAARTLAERQNELDTLRKALSDAEIRLEQADSANAMLAGENAELIETLRDAGVDAMQYEEDDLEFEHEEQEPSPEPYCEPVEGVISEDDVHLEQKLGDAPMPTLNLAEQIMAEQRKASAQRRQAPDSNREKKKPSSSIEHVVRQYISGPSDTEAQASVPPPRPVEQSDRFLRREGERLSDYQESLLNAIIRKDIRRFCGIDALSMPHRPMDN